MRIAKHLLIEIEKLLRWLANSSADEKRENSMELSEASQALVAQLETLLDSPDPD